MARRLYGTHSDPHLKDFFLPYIATGPRPTRDLRSDDFCVGGARAYRGNWGNVVRVLTVSIDIIDDVGSYFFLPR